ncbi:MAG: hypothetical protein RL757_1119 [Bacteroidota bacterium]|jgi:hypothetical protein
MCFELMPMLDLMREYYQKPADLGRFNQYLAHINAQNGSPVTALSGYNPMGKAHVLEKLTELWSQNAEDIAQKVISEINKKYQLPFTFRVALVLADDEKGGWTNHFSTHYDSFFKLKYQLSQGECAPFFWTSENFDAEKIEYRIKMYLFNSIYQLQHGAPKTLRQHVAALRWAQQKSEQNVSFLSNLAFQNVQVCFEKYADSEHRHIIIPFLYGDQAATNLGYPPLGIDYFQGFDAAQQLVLPTKK